MYKRFTISLILCLWFPSIVLCQDSTAVDTLLSPSERTLFSLVVNAEEFYYRLAELRGQDRDTYKAAYEFLAEAMKVDKENYRDMELLRTSYTALDQQQKDYIASLEKDVAKQTRRKKFWKTVALVEGGIVIFVTGIIYTTTK